MLILISTSHANSGEHERGGDPECRQFEMANKYVIYTVYMCLMNPQCFLYSQVRCIS